MKRKKISKKKLKKQLKDDIMLLEFFDYLSFIIFENEYKSTEEIIEVLSNSLKRKLVKENVNKELDMILKKLNINGIKS